MYFYFYTEKAKKLTITMAAKSGSRILLLVAFFNF